ncbi:hypothetical protein ACFV0T_26535 [Streptomyces sp. NPDC059582]|uniref:hypothetical protein n=1 Tax=Streptomyces sp. NPDC059582 TaxID=3346875 RepID=UPI00368AA75A
MGKDNDIESAGDTPAGLLAELHGYFQQHPVTGPAGHSYIAAGSRPTMVHAPAPGNTNWGVIEHIGRTVGEVDQFTRKANPAATEPPAHVAAVYEWCVENTQNAPEDVQQRRDALMYRQQLEHAIAMGDKDVVRPHRCPGCNTFGLVWDRRTLSVRCTNRRCLGEDGLSTTWTLARLAHEHVIAQKSLRVRAT